MNTKRRYSGIQDILQGLKWSDCCHFLALMSIAEEVIDEPVDFLELIRIAKEHRLIDDEFTVLDNCGLLAAMTGKTWVQTEVSTLPDVILDNEYTEVIYYNPRTKFKHFRRRGFDTLKDSVTVREGYILNYRIYKYT